MTETLRTLARLWQSAEALADLNHTIETERTRLRSQRRHPQ